MAEDAPSARVAREVFLLTLNGLGGDAHENLGWAFNRAVGSLRDVFVEAGDDVYRVGEPSEEHYFVASGEVRLTKPGAPDWTMGERSVFGSLDMIHERPRTRAATAVVATHLLSMRGDEWWSLLEDRFELARRVVLNLSKGVHALRMRPPPHGGFDAPSSPPSRPWSAVNVIGRTLLLRSVPLFARASIQTLTGLADAASEVDAAEGALVFARGALGRTLAVVVSGTVTASRETPSASFDFGPGDLVVGAAGIAHGAEYEVRAGSAARILTVSFDDYYDAMEDHFSLVRAALVTLAEEQETLLDR
jgi:CRP-like cAMP-binding protein